MISLGLSLALETVASLLGGAVPSFLFHDTFTDTDGTLLDAHTPEVGGPWVNYLAGSYNFNKIISNTAQQNAGTSASFVDIGTVDFDETAYILNPSGGNKHFGLLTNCGSGGNGDLWWIQAGTGTGIIYEMTGGALSAVGNLSRIDIDELTGVSLISNAGNIEVKYIDHNEVLQTYNKSVKHPTLTGVGIFTNTASVGSYIDSIEVLP